MATKTLTENNSGQNMTSFETARNSISFRELQTGEQRNDPVPDTAPTTEKKGLCHNNDLV